MDMIGPMRVTTKLAFALAIPTFVILSGAVTLAYAQPSPSPSGSSAASGATALPGDPTKGAQLYAQDCSVCHGASLEGGIGPALNPIEKLPGGPLRDASRTAPPQYPTPAGGSPRILILFSDTGGGHRAAARALTDALKLLDPGCTVTVADPLIGQGPLLVRRLASLYAPMIRRSRRAWGALYHTSNTQPTFAAIRAVFGPGVRKALRHLLGQHDPDVVLSVLPFVNHVA